MLVNENADKVEVKCDIRIADVDVDEKRHVVLPINRSTRLVVDYPLSHKVDFELCERSTWTLYDLIDKITQVYKDIYRDSAQYNVHSHNIDDLYLEGIVIDKWKNVITLSVGN